MTAQSLDYQAHHYDVLFDKFRHAIVWLIFASSFVVFFQPAPCDWFFFLAFPLFLFSGLRITVTIIPLILLLFIYNFAATVSYFPVSDDPDALWFVLPSIYMAGSAFFFASYLATDTEARFNLIKNGYVVGATIAAIIGLLHYTNVGGIGTIILELVDSELAWPDRASGFFKDPNVFSTYLVLPCAMLVQGFMLGTIKRPFLNGISLLLISTALLLAYSRGAWINILMSVAMIGIFTFVLTGSAAIRMRVVFSAIVGIALISTLIVIIMSIPNVRDFFLSRLTLLKSYDQGETGRFGNQVNAIPMLLQLPLGFGPYQFPKIFGLAPHNTFLNAFASCGWVGGLAYIALTACNVFVSIRSALTKSPFQNQAILLGACLLAVTFQGVQIDTEHWRHYYWIMGMMWGIFAAAAFHQTMNSRTATVVSNASA
jgi:hypothetical protein